MTGKQVKIERRFCIYCGTRRRIKFFEKGSHKCSSCVKKGKRVKAFKQGTLTGWNGINEVYC